MYNTRTLRRKHYRRWPFPNLEKLSMSRCTYERECDRRERENGGRKRQENEEQSFMAERERTRNDSEEKGERGEKDVLFEKEF